MTEKITTPEIPLAVVRFILNHRRRRLAKLEQQNKVANNLQPATPQPEIEAQDEKGPNVNR